ncbi:hypothetical protein O9G_001041 [Rozella allomycis CSF55]|uniref:Uncharacterized protein n=1 Tax=Rozella allomycis (strain CSF55) TaxID=988480 RepID=A0A075AR05_ROZAC|nr:hypothetical protein O9G_001041 [Rozella allomycis CSF55]|eukprot:EPZ31130.1 hypothetical protein O9G_001041 [Rozella allomycis CSF55]
MPFTSPIKAVKTIQTTSHSSPRRLNIKEASHNINRKHRFPTLKNTEKRLENKRSDEMMNAIFQVEREEHEDFMRRLCAKEELEESDFLTLEESNTADTKLIPCLFDHSHGMSLNHFTNTASCEVCKIYIKLEVPQAGLPNDMQLIHNIKQSISDHRLNRFHYDGTMKLQLSTDYEGEFYFTCFCEECNIYC